MHEKPSMFKELVPDIKSDLIKSAVMGVIATAVAAVFSLASEAIPAEFKEAAVIAVFGAVIALLSLVLILIHRHRSNVKLIITFVSLIIAIAVISLFAFANYAWKVLPFTTANPTFIVFYPERVSSVALQTHIESAMRELPGRLKGPPGLLPNKANCVA